MANNPNTPIAILEKLATWFPEIEENSEAEDGDYVHAAVAKNPNTPIYILEKLAKHRSSYVREQVANNINTPDVLLEELAIPKTIYRYSNVLVAVVNNPNTSISTVKSSLEYLAGEKEAKFRQAALKHPDVTDKAILIANFVNRKPGITVELLKQLATDKRLHIRYLVVEHPLTSAETLETLSNNKDTKLRHKILQHKNTESRTLQKLTIWLIDKFNKDFATTYYFSEIKRIFFQIINHPNINEKILENIVFVNYSPIHLELVKSPLASSKILYMIIDLYLNDEIKLSHETMYQISQHPNLSSETIENIYIEHTRKNLDFAHFINHPNCSTYILEELAYNHFPHIRLRVASNPNTPIYILNKLSKDREPAVKRSVLKNKNLPIEIFDRLSDYFDEY